VIRGRRSLWWLAGPPVAYLAAMPLANRVEPVIAGLPFSAAWLLLATLATPVFVWLAARRDPVWRAAEQRRRTPGDGRGPR
jgi:hypothetical protein